MLGYNGQLVDWVKTGYGWILEIVNRRDGIKGFQVFLYRWMVECTSGWLGLYRCVTKDFESLPKSSEAMIYAAMSHLMVMRLARI